MESTTSENITLASNLFELTIIRSKKRRRTVALMVKPPAQIVVHAPYKTNIKFINDFIYQRTSWILTKFNELKAVSNKQVNLNYVDGETFYFLGQSYSLRILEHQKVMINCQLREPDLIVYLKSQANSKDIMKQLHHWYRRQAKHHIHQRLQYWSEQLNIKFNKFFISSAKTRWGSCNSQNDIRINWRLMMMPMTLIDYVIVHELCHVIHKDHSSKFWALVNQILPDYKQRQQQLKIFARELSFGF